MEKMMKKVVVLMILVLPISINVWAQELQSEEQKEAVYTKTITERATKIVATLGITNEKTGSKVSNIISQQYRDLSKIHGERSEKIKVAKEQLKEDKVQLAEEIKQIETSANVLIDKLHAKYLKKLAKNLNDSQVEMVKDGMTYRVLPITLKGYNEMLPNLSETQKAQILAYLTEAREHAMDAETAEKKHAWFGKYKGKINNYLSAAGIDMKKAGLEWEKRIAAAKAAGQQK